MANNEYQLTTSVRYKPFTCIPRYLLDLTKLKTVDEKRLRHQTYQLIQCNPDLKHIIKLLHPDEESINMHEIAHRYNFDHLLEMVISSIIEKKLSGNYLKKCDLSHAIEIEKHCRCLRPNSLSSGPRLSLLFMYLTLSSIEDNGKKKKSIYSTNLVTTVSVYEKYINTNIYESDWMLLVLKLLDEGIGKDKLIYHLKNQDSLIGIINEIDSMTRKVILGSLINYANSIEEEHILFQDFI